MPNINEDTEILEHTKTLTLLCVEDDKTTQNLYNLIFKDLVKAIVVSDNTEDAYNRFTEGDIDVVISSHGMPAVNGLGLIKRIRETSKNTPIILVSAINDVDVILDALHSGVNSLVAKPIVNKEILEALKKASKIIIADDYLQEQRDKRLQELQDKDRYNSYQEDLGFSKELNILRNDFYYQMLNSDGAFLIDFLYQPLDVMSGDAYSARRINEHCTFYLMIDGMGKGLSASLTAMIMASFVNHVIDKMLYMDSFDLGILINETMEYIKPILLDEEALAIDYILINNEDNVLYYAKFAMPVLLMENKQGDILRLKSNNPPLSKYQPTFNIDKHDINDVIKFLIYSDGIVENETIFEDKPYAEFIEEDFSNSFTREDLKNSFIKKISSQEDDVTLIFINRLDEVYTTVANKRFATTLNDVESANEWYTDIWKSITEDEDISYHAGLAFTELFMNAYEHGNLGLDSATKNHLLDDDIYFDTLLEMEKDCKKSISVRVDKIEHSSVNYIVTHITDEGDGFDTQILSEIFRNSQTFNGRGVFVSRKNSLGIYYNSEGNSVLYLNKV